MRKAREYFRANPQVFILAVIVVVLGLGSFIAIVISLATSGGNTTGQPVGWTAPAVGWTMPAVGWVRPAVGWMSPAVGWITPAVGWISPLQQAVL